MRRKILVNNGNIQCRKMLRRRYKRCKKIQREKERERDGESYTAINACNGSM
jgi:hypothetical protein